MSTLLYTWFASHWLALAVAYVVGVVVTWFGLVWMGLVLMDSSQAPDPENDPKNILLGSCVLAPVLPLTPILVPVLLMCAPLVLAFAGTLAVGKLATRSLARRVTSPRAPTRTPSSVPRPERLIDLAAKLPPWILDPRVNNEELLSHAIEDIEDWRGKKRVHETKLILHAATSILLAVVNSQRLRLARFLRVLRAR
jgi:hypothetical protein